LTTSLLVSRLHTSSPFHLTHRLCSFSNLPSLLHLFFAGELLLVGALMFSLKNDGIQKLISCSRDMLKLLGLSCKHISALPPPAVLKEQMWATRARWNEAGKRGEGVYLYLL